MWNLEDLKRARESEDKVEFKRGERGNISYGGGDRVEPSKRRRCILGYVVAFCNEGGGTLVIGMTDGYPHEVVGTTQAKDALGDLESDIYRDTGIRVDIYELYEDEVNKDGRVVVIEIPSRRPGKIHRFEDVALMRIGEELRPMSDEQLLLILNENEPDFSEKICEKATMDDLDREAIKIMKAKYAEKQGNDKFLSMPDKRILSDLKLVRNGKITNAAVILVGKETFIQDNLSQAGVNLEYRHEVQIPFDQRKEYHDPFYILLDKVWEDINLRNGNSYYQDGPYIFNISFFNKEVIREAITNAISHRDYGIMSRTVIKQYPKSISIINAGGFPKGVTVDNIISTSSVPRNKLIVDVLCKTGIVEASGQGVDKIFYETLSEGKPAPDYSNSTDSQVELEIFGFVKHGRFSMFVDSIQKTLPEGSKLTVLDLITLASIRDNYQAEDKNTIKRLQKMKLIEKHGQTKGTKYLLCKKYYEFIDDLATYYKHVEWNIDQIMNVIAPHINAKKNVKMDELIKLTNGHYNRNQLKYFVDKMLDKGYLESIGSGYNTCYKIGKNCKLLWENIKK